MWEKLIPVAGLSQGTTLQAAEKGLDSSEKCKKHHAGAKAIHLYSMTYGTTEVVP
jgi:hypothetical protein